MAYYLIELFLQDEICLLISKTSNLFKKDFQRFSLCIPDRTTVESDDQEMGTSDGRFSDTICDSHTGS